MTVKADKQIRPLIAIAADIKANWPGIGYTGYAAIPYVEAMSYLDRITDSYYEDSAEYVVRYFLSNAGNWRGEHAKRIKAELRAMLA